MAIAPRSFWKYTERVTLSASTVAAVLEAIGDASGDIRTQMEADGWTFALDGTEGIALTPTADGTSDKRIVLGGVNSGTPTPPMRLPDTFVSAVLLCGTVFGVGGGTFDWDASNAGFTGGSIDFAGYSRALAPANSTHVVVAYTAHAIAIFLDAGTNGTLKPAFLGGWGIPVDPDFVESDGRLWCESFAGGVATTGLAAAFWQSSGSSSGTANSPLVHGTANGNAHCYFRNPGSGAWGVMSRHTGFVMGVTAQSLIGWANPQRRVLIPVPLGEGTVGTGGIVCEPEGIYVYTDELHHQAPVVNDGGELKEAAYIAANGFSSAVDAMALEMIDLQAVVTP